MAKKPGEPLPKLVEEFLRFVLSREGQEIVVKDGYGPLPAKVIRTAARSAEIIRRTTALVPHPDVEDRFQPKSLAA